MDPMEYIVPNRKRLPYGMMNFAVIRREDYYYVDKTRFIPMIEQADRFFFFIRPRRFGKSLTLNVLQHYYDVRTRDKFNDLFGDLYIGKHPTANRNSYLVLYLNFSGITGELNDYRKGLDAHCQITCRPRRAIVTGYGRKERYRSCRFQYDRTRLFEKQSP